MPSIATKHAARTADRRTGEQSATVTILAALQARAVTQLHTSTHAHARQDERKETMQHKEDAYMCLKGGTREKEAGRRQREASRGTFASS